MSKILPAGLQDHLDTGVTTMAYCWKVTRNDAVVFGFTEHDVDITFGGQTYEAATGFTASTAATELGLNVDNLNLDGAMSSQSITEDDLAAGRFDNAEVELYWVNFENPTQYLLLLRGTIGEVSRKETAFSAELRGLAHKLQQKQGRKYQKYCDARLGSVRCGIDLESAAYKSPGAVSEVTSNLQLTVTGLTSIVSGFYSLGVLTFTNGLNIGLSAPVKLHEYTATVHTITLWGAPPFSVAVSDTFNIYAGCDFDAATCRVKFGNLVNFQGFPHIPGNDYISLYAVKGGSEQDGGSMFP